MAVRIGGEKSLDRLYCHLHEESGCRRKSRGEQCDTTSGVVTGVARHQLTIVPVRRRNIILFIFVTSEKKVGSRLRVVLLLKLITNRSERERERRQMIVLSKMKS